MCDDGHGVIFLQFADQLFDFGRRDRVQSRCRLIQQDDLGFDGHSAGNAQALLLTARERQTALVQLVFDFVPDSRFGEGRLDALVHVGAAQVLVQTHAKSDVVVNRHRERRGFLEHHANLRTQQVQVLAFVQDILAIKLDLAFGTLPWVEAVHTVERAQQSGLAATGRSNKGRDAVLGDVQVDVFQAFELAVIKVQIAHFDGVLSRCLVRHVDSCEFKND